MAEVPEQSSEAAEQASAMAVISSEVAIAIGKTHHREYREYKDRFLKRSLGYGEQVYDRFSGLHLTSPTIPAQLENEAAALRFVKKYTDIPVPKVLAAFEKNGIYFLWTEIIRGVTMKQLLPAEQQIVAKEVEKHVATLQSLRSRHVGTLTGTNCLPGWLVTELPRDMKLPSISSATEDFVFCHMDLGQTNILVDPLTLKINAIIDWEFAGFFPSYFEGHYYRSPYRSGQQYKSRMNVPKIVGFFTTAKQSVPETGPGVL